MPAFFPAIGDPELAEIYEEECATASASPRGSSACPAGPGFVHVTEDPETRLGEDRARTRSRRADVRQLADARSALAGRRACDDRRRVRQSGVYRVVTPDECVALATRRHGRVLFHPLMGGIPPELGWESLELFAAKVLPRLT